MKGSIWNRAFVSGTDRGIHGNKEPGSDVRRSQLYGTSWRSQSHIRRVWRHRVPGALDAGDHQPEPPEESQGLSRNENRAALLAQAGWVCRKGLQREVSGFGRCDGIEDVEGQRECLTRMARRGRFWKDDGPFW